jgi:hypothetical protein
MITVYESYWRIIIYIHDFGLCGSYPLYIFLKRPFSNTCCWSGYFDDDPKRFVLEFPFELPPNMLSLLLLLPPIFFVASPIASLTAKQG